MTQRLSSGEGALEVSLFQHESYPAFVDALMMFGASIRVSRSDGAQIVLSKPLSQRRALGWIVGTVLAHGMALSVDLPCAEDVITYVSEPLIFTNAEHARWYSGKARRVPINVAISDATMTCWSVAALAADDLESQFIMFPHPAFSQLGFQYTLANRATALGFPIEVREIDGAIGIKRCDRENLARRLAPIVPRAAWDSKMPVA